MGGMNVPLCVISGRAAAFRDAKLSYRFARYFFRLFSLHDTWRIVPPPRRKQVPSHPPPRARSNTGGACSVGSKRLVRHHARLEAVGLHVVTQLLHEVVGRALRLEGDELALLLPDLADVELAQVGEGLARRVVQLEEDGAVLVERLLR